MSYELLGDGYYLLHVGKGMKPIPVEVYTIATSPQPRQFVRGLHIACTLRRAHEQGYTLEPLSRANQTELAVGHPDWFEQDANDLDKLGGHTP